MRGEVASTWEPAQRSRVDPAQGWPRRAGPPARGLHVPRQGTLKVSSRSGRSVSTNQIDPPGRGGWPTSGKPAAVRPQGCGIFKNGAQCVGARRTPRYPLERGHLAGRGRWNRSVNFDLVHSSRGPGKVLLPHHCHRMMSL